MCCCDNIADSATVLFAYYQNTAQVSLELSCRWCHCSPLRYITNRIMYLLHATSDSARTAAELLTHEHGLDRLQQ
jgi:hypothetical protein